MFQVLVFFLKKWHPILPKKVTSLISSNPLSKLRPYQAPLFENLVGGSTPAGRKGVWGCTLGNLSENRGIYICIYIYIYTYLSKDILRDFRVRISDP